MINDQEFITYKFYDAKGHRLTIHAVPSYVAGETRPAEGDPEHLLVRIIPCSFDENFSKKRGKAKLERFILDQRAGLPLSVKSVITLYLKVYDGKPKFTFLRWCEENYYKKYPVMYALPVDVLVKGRGEEAILGPIIGMGKPLPIDFEEVSELQGDLEN